MASVKVEKPVSRTSKPYSSSSDKYYESIGGVNPEWNMSMSDAAAYRSGATGGVGGANPYQSALNAANKAVRAQVNQGVQTLQAQIPTINQSYDDVARQAYANYRQQQLQTPANTSGLASGTADSLALQGQLNFENTQSQTERERANALAGVQADIANLQSTGDLQLAQNAQQYSMMAEQYRQQMEQEAYNRMLTERQWEAQQEETAYNRSLAAQQLAMRNSGGGSAATTKAPSMTEIYQLEQLGYITPAQRQQMLNQYLGQYGIAGGAEAPQTSGISPYSAPITFDPRILNGTRQNRPAMQPTLPTASTDVAALVRQYQAMGYSPEETARLIQYGGGMPQ